MQPDSRRQTLRSHAPRVERPADEDFSRRDFVSTSLAGAAGLCLPRDGLDRGGDGSDAQRGRLQALAALRAARQTPAAQYRPAVRQSPRRGNVADRCASFATRWQRRSRRCSARRSRAVPQGLARRRRRRHAEELRSDPGLGWEADSTKAGPEGFVIRTGRIGNRPVIAIASDGEIGALYGAYHFLRLMQTGQPIDRLDITERPKVQLRMLNHWDNMDGSIERGYAGRSLWQWNELPGHDRARDTWTTRARTRRSASTATVINNVNANVAHPHAGLPREGRGARRRVAAVRSADVPVGELRGADPPRRAEDGRSARPRRHRVVEGQGRRDLQADSRLRRVPRQSELRRAARSEGLRPQSRRGRERAWPTPLAPHGGNVIWRAFIYDEDVDPDRAKRAYIEFTRLDGQFRPNVLVQVKNGAIDFMPREPFHPLFGALKQDAGRSPRSRRRRSTSARRSISSTSARCGRSSSTPTPTRKARARPSARSLEGAVIPYRVTGMVSVAQSRPRPQLVRASLFAVELVRVRPAGVEPRALGAADCRRVDAHDVHQRCEDRRDDPRR